MDATEVNSLSESNDNGEYLQLKFLDEYCAAMVESVVGDIDDNNRNNSADGNRTHGTTNNDQTVDEFATEMRKLTNSDLGLPSNVVAINQHDRFPTNNKKRQRRPLTSTAQKKWSTKSPTDGKFCAFCKNNGEPDYVYKSHKLRDNQKRVCCPRLRAYKCQNCGATGDFAHTVKYCPVRESMVRVAGPLMFLNDVLI